MLISGSHNASIGNKPFTNKLESYKRNPLLNQQAEIKDFAVNDVWKIQSIEKRHKAIIDFATKKWNFTEINVSDLINN